MSCENKTVTIEGVEYKLTPVHRNQTISVSKREFKACDLIIADKQMSRQEAIIFAASHKARLLTVAELHAYRIQLKVILQGRADNYFWSSEEHPNITSLAWNVYLGYGNTNYSIKTFSNSVVCVRC
jgi:hypothetical protein